MRKYLVLMLLLALCVGANAGDKEVKIYATECDGHRMGFLIIAGDSIRKEDYYAQAKTSVYACKKRVLSVSVAEQIIPIGGGVVFGKKKYLLQSSSILCGDYSALYNSFDRLSNQEKLNVCRNLYVCRYLYAYRKRKKGKWRSFEQIVKDNHAILKMEPDVFLREMK